MRSLVEGPAVVTAVEWFDEIDSTNRVVADAARAGGPQGLLAVADAQTAGRGRRGRSWVAPAGTSLLLSLLLRPDTEAIGTLPLLVGLAVAETITPHVPDHDVALKWPNDVLIDGRKTAGILTEAVAGAAVVGVGVDVDWREVPRSADLSGATSLAEVAGRDVDRWRILAGVMGVFSRRYDEWRADPIAFLPDYRARCATLGAQVRVRLLERDDVLGRATDVDDAGRLVVRTAGGDDLVITAGDVEHVRPA